MSTARTAAETTGAPATSLPGRLKAGLIVAIILGLGDVMSIAAVPAAPQDGEGDGPPIPILILASILGLVTLVAVWAAWRRRSRRAIRVIAGSRILSAVTALPAFFVDIPVGLLIVTAIGVVLTVLCVVLLLSPSGAKPLQPVTD